MRLSAAIPLPLPFRVPLGEAGRARPVEPAEEPALLVSTAEPVALDPPDDLDQRVRLSGEW